MLVLSSSRTLYPSKSVVGPFQSRLAREPSAPLNTRSRSTWSRVSSPWSAVSYLESQSRPSSTGTAPAARSAATARSGSGTTLLSSTSRIDDRPHDGRGVREVAKRCVRRTRRERRRIIVAGRDGDRARTDSPAAGDVARRVADDDARVASQRAADVHARAVASDGREIVPVFAITAKRTDGKTCEPDSRRPQLSFGSLDAVARQEAKDNVVACL